MTKKILLCFLLSHFSLFIYSQHPPERLRTANIPEVIVTKNRTSSTEKKLKVKWLLKENEELVTFIENDRQMDMDLKEISFRIANLSGDDGKIIFKIYSVKNNQPFEEIFSKIIHLQPKEEANKLTFGAGNSLLKGDGIYIGFEYTDRKGEKGIYVFTESRNTPKTMIKLNNFIDENLFLDEKFRKVDIYLKIKVNKSTVAKNP